MPRDTEYRTVCPHCGHVCTDAAEIKDRDNKPREGDLSMCDNCGHFSIFVARATGGLRKPSKWETNQFIRDEEVLKMIGMWAMNRVLTGPAPASTDQERKGQAINALLYAANSIADHFDVCPACLVMVTAEGIAKSDPSHAPLHRGSSAVH